MNSSIFSQNAIPIPQSGIGSTATKPWLKIELGEYYLVNDKKLDETKLIKIISITPGGLYYIECDGKKMWKNHIASEYSNWSEYYVLEHLPKDYVTHLFREQKLERIVKDV